uniref:Uncharacterized protein n=1 Tax=Ditylenchus dipsaci TaxID=166011 RepID=A0A915EJI8_9BILA
MGGAGGDELVHCYLSCAAAAAAQAALLNLMHISAIKNHQFKQLSNISVVEPKNPKSQFSIPSQTTSFTGMEIAAIPPAKLKNSDEEGMEMKKMKRVIVHVHVIQQRATRKQKVDTREELPEFPLHHKKYQECS